MQYKHFSSEERETIQELLWEKRSVRAIARTLNRSPSSVSREIARNKPAVFNRYTPRLAHERALEKRKSRGRKERLKNTKIRTYVVRHLKEGWSPEQVAGRMRYDTGDRISHEAVYQFIYARVPLYGALQGEDLRPYLRRKRKQRHRHGMRKHKTLRFHGISIDERPRAVSKKRRYGDWEGDTVESSFHHAGVNTLLERKSGMFFVTKLEAKDAEATGEAVRNRFASLPARLRRTLTLDNGPENACWRDIELGTGARCFFAHPYHSWERGGNENANGLLREYFPKGTDFRMIHDDAVRNVERRLNSRPRKRLGYKTPLEVWGVALRS